MYVCMYIYICMYVCIYIFRLRPDVLIKFIVIDKSKTCYRIFSTV